MDGNCGKKCKLRVRVLGGVGKRQGGKGVNANSSEDDIVLINEEYKKMAKFYYSKEVNLKFQIKKYTF